MNFEGKCNTLKSTCLQRLFLYCQTPSSPGLPYVHSIPRVTQSDQGMYTCVARNVVGKAYAAAYLQVNGSDHITRWAWHLPSKYHILLYFYFFVYVKVIQIKYAFVALKSSNIRIQREMSYSNEYVVVGIPRCFTLDSCWPTWVSCSALEWVEHEDDITPHSSLTTSVTNNPNQCF